MRRGTTLRASYVRALSPPFVLRSGTRTQNGAIPSKFSSSPGNAPPNVGADHKKTLLAPHSRFSAMRYKYGAMAHLPSSRVLVAPLVLAAALIGCAQHRPVSQPVAVRPAPPPLQPPPPPPKLVRLVVLPLDKLALPGTAEEINAKLAQVKMAGAADAVAATVSMETAQLQSECAEPTDGCYLRIARLVEADRLLWAQVEKVGGKGAKKKKAKPSTRIQFILFDRDMLGVTGQAEESFPGAITGADLDKLIASTIGAQSTAPPAPTPPAGQMAPATGAAAAAQPAAPPQIGRA